MKIMSLERYLIRIVTVIQKLRFYRFYNSSEEKFPRERGPPFKFLRFSDIDCVESELRLLMTEFSFSVRRQSGMVHQRPHF